MTKQTLTDFISTELVQGIKTDVSSLVTKFE